MLEAQGIGHRFGQRPVLVDVSLRIRPGEMVALCGPNGAGKSTLLAAMAGDFAPGQGQVFLDGQIISALPAALLARRRAVLEQTPLLNAGFTLRELLALAIPKEVAPSPAGEMIRAALDDVALLARIDDNCLTLSGGQRHRAHLARILVQRAASASTGESFCLLLDEPTAGLDIAHRIAVMRIARDAARRGAGVLAVLHDLELAAAFADRVVLMHEGRIVADGSPARVFTTARLSAIYDTGIAVDMAADGRLRIAPVYDPDIRPQAPRA